MADNPGCDDEPPSRDEESPPPTPGAVLDLTLMRGSSGFEAAYTSETANYPTRWIKFGHTPAPASVGVLPTQALLRKCAMLGAG